MIRFTAVVCLVLVASSSVSAREYTGADRGTLILSLGVTEKALDSYQLYYKRVGESPDLFWGDPHVSYAPHAGWQDDPDYKGTETGEVHVIHLKPGNYEIYTFSLVKVVGTHERGWDPQKQFSIPFTIKPGEATYVGDFNGFGIFEEWRARGGYFVLSDQHERDIPIAQKKDPNMGPLTMSVADPVQLQIPGIEAHKLPDP